MSVRQFSVPTFSVTLPGYVALVVALVVVWGFGDAVSTLWAVQATGSIQGEANPWIRLVLSHDPVLLVVLKAGVVALAGWLLLTCRDFVESVPGWRVWFVGVLALGSTIVATNLYVGFDALF
ncbi:MAG: DUF5658 family protein [Halapricum sp.]